MTFRSIEQDKQEITTLEKNSKSYSKHQLVVDRIAKIPNKDKILEVGCGNGIILDMLQKKNSDSKVFGLDISQVMVNEMMKKNPNVHAKQGNALNLPYGNDIFDVVIFSSSFHEIFSIESEKGAIKALEEAYRVLNNKGTLIINEGFKPEGKLKVKFEKYLLDKFLKFCKDFQLRKIEYILLADNHYELSQWDFCEFLTKYKNEPIKYQFEMKEEHFCFSKEEYLKILSGIGFDVKVEVYKECKLVQEGFESKDNATFEVGLVIGIK